MTTIVATTSVSMGSSSSDSVMGLAAEDVFAGF